MARRLLVRSTVLFAAMLPAPAAADPSAGVAAPAATYTLHGLNFSPYLDGQDPNHGSNIPEAQILDRLRIIQPRTTWVRTFGSSHGLERTPALAHSLGLQVAAGAWIGEDLAANAVEVANLIAAAQAGFVDIAIVGSEVLHRGDVSEAQLLAYIAQVRAAIPATIPVTTADTFNQLLSRPAVIAASDVVMANFYPFWQEVALVNAICVLDAAYQQMVTAAAGKPVLVSETGWPSAGNSKGAAIPSRSNAARYFAQFISWARDRDVDYFYFSAFDESWKALYDEGPLGAHWGLWTRDGVLKPGMQAPFDGETEPIGCSSTPGGVGTPSIAFTYVPPYGNTSEALQGSVRHVPVSDFNVAIYIKVAGGWWSKPTFDNPITTILQDGSWLAAIVTGGSDQLATEIAAFVIPSAYTPPLAAGVATLPSGLFSTAVAVVQTSRTPSAIRGRLLDPLGHPVGGAPVGLGGSAIAFTTSAPDGTYSFPDLPASGTVTVTPSASDFVFSPISRDVVLTSGFHDVDFAAVYAANALVNGQFDAGMAAWLTFATPDSSHIVSSIAGGLLQFARLPAAQPPNEAVVLQPTDIAFPEAAALTVTFDLGNTDSVRKRIKVLVHDLDFSDSSSCTFFLDPGAPVRTFGMRLHTTSVWTDATISFYASTAGVGGFYQLDNVSLQYAATGPTNLTECVDPAVPTPPGGADGPTLLTNGDFATGTTTGWGTVGPIVTQVTGGVLEVKRGGTSPAPVILQPTGQAVANDQILTATFQLGNSSPSRHRTKILIHDLDFTDAPSCVVWLPPDTPLQTYTMRVYATKAWTNATVSIYPSTGSTDDWTLVDNLTLQRTPAAVTTGTTCLEPGAVGPRQERASATGVVALASGTDDVRREPQSTVWRYESGAGSGWSLTGEGWRAVADRDGEDVLAWPRVVDLTAATSARLSFESWLTALHSRAALQVSRDGIEWITAEHVRSSDTWVPVGLDLATFLGDVVSVRFVLFGMTQPGGDQSDVWRVRDVDVVIEAADTILMRSAAAQIAGPPRR